MNVQQKTKGFTIVEVVLVLAIAGLIFLIVFLAVPALQRNQRDTQRRSDMSRLLSATQNYASNNKGTFSGVTTDALLSSRVILPYVLVGTDDWSDPGGSGAASEDHDGIAGAPFRNGYSTTYRAPTNQAQADALSPAVGAIDWVKNARCNGDGLTRVTSDDAIAIRTALEGGGFYCINN